MGCDGGHHRACSGGAEEDWFLQTWWRVEHEAEEEASDPCPQGRQSVHQGTLRLQGQACFEDRQGVTDEEVQGNDQLSSVASLRDGPSGPWWAVSPDPLLWSTVHRRSSAV